MRNVDRSLFRKGNSILSGRPLEMIGARLRHERERLGYSLQEVGLALDKSEGILLLIEGGKKRPSVNLLAWFARAGADLNFVLANRHDTAHASAPLDRIASELAETNRLFRAINTHIAGPSVAKPAFHPAQADCATANTGRVCGCALAEAPNG